MSEEVFVVMQIGEKGSPERRRADEVFDFVIKPVLEVKGLKPYRADLDPTPGNITPQLLKKLLDARVVIADLTGRNPNVFYELGIAHSFQKPLIALAASVKDLPFDTSDERIIELSAHVGDSLGMAQGERAKASLVAALEIVLSEDYEARSPVTAVATGRRIDDMSSSDPIAADLADLREAVEDLRGRPAAQRIDLEGVMSVRMFIDKLVSEGAVTAERITELITPTTGDAFDTWVHGLIRRLAQPGTGGWSDEAPF